MDLSYFSEYLGPLTPLPAQYDSYRSLINSILRVCNYSAKQAVIKRHILFQLLVLGFRRRELHIWREQALDAGLEGTRKKVKLLISVAAHLQISLFN